MIRDGQGEMYGTTRGGGLASCGDGSCGTVYKIDSSGNETVIFSFPGGNSGTNPIASVVRDAHGNLYGTTQGNGVIDGASVVYKIDPKGQETVLFEAGRISQGCCLDSPVVLDPQGNVYGMSPYAGVPNCGWQSNGLGCGTLFKITPGGKFTVLHNFAGTDGMQPEGGLVMDKQGNLYGSANFGGIKSCKNPGYGYWEPGCGTIYKLDTNGKFSVLYTFTGKADGSFPLGLIIDDDANLYGLTEWGGDDKRYYNHLYGYGTVFELSASGKFTTLFTFTPKTTINNYYASHLLRDAKGNLYGLQQMNNCAKGGGCLFRVDPKGKYTDLYDFEYLGEGPDGWYPMGVVFGSDKDMYGTMEIGGSENGDCEDGCGTVFHLAFP